MVVAGVDVGAITAKAAIIGDGKLIAASVIMARYDRAAAARQVLDQALVSRALRHRARTDIVHVNVDYPRVDDTIASDHEPLVTALRLVKRPQRPE